MKLEHLMQGYNFNGISAKIEREINNESERAGVINFDKDTNASYLLDDEGFVVAINLFSNCVVAENKTINNQLEHTIQTLKVIQKTIELLGNTKKEEANSILEKLNMFSGKIKEKSVIFTNHIYRVQAANGLLLFSIVENIEEENH